MNRNKLFYPEDIGEYHQQVREDLEIKRSLVKKEAADKIAANSLMAFKHHHDKVSNLSAMMDIREM